MPTWPATLPQNPLVDGFAEDAPGGLVVFQPDAGPPDVRRRTSAAARPLTVQYRVTAAQLATFETFFDDDLGGGALQFDWPHPRLGTVAVRFAIKGSEPAWRVQPRARGMAYTLSFGLWILPA